VVDEFLSGLIRTNKSHSFFTDWQKAAAYRDTYKDELALLSSITGSHDPAKELSRLLKSYPRINSLIPLLVATRPQQNSRSDIPSLLVLNEDDAEDSQYFFAEQDLSALDIKATVDFTAKTGLLDELKQIKNHKDYYFGVEVGLDSNARKNRSGNAMETLLEPHLKDFVVKHNGMYETQMTFEKAAELFGVNVPSSQGNKKGDFMLYVNNKPINIETNYFDGGGSKQEIMNSYIPRAHDLKRAGWGFALVTDGLGWRSNRAQLEQGFRRIGNVYNIKMCAEGKLEKLVNQ
jgi:type II restriction enzyme